MPKYVLGLAATLGLLAGSCSEAPDRAAGNAHQDPTVLTLGHTNRGGPFDQLLQWAEEVERLSDGALRIKFENAWRADPKSEQTLLTEIRAGRYDLGSVSARVFDQVGYRGFEALSAPLLVDSYELQTAVFKRGIPRDMLSGVSSIGLAGAAVLPGVLHRVAGSDFAPTSPRLLAGKVVGTPDSRVGEATISALKARAQGLFSSGDVSTYDAITAQPAAVSGNGWQDRFRHLAGNIVLWPRPLVIVLGNKAAALLDARQREMLTRAGEHLWPSAIQAAREDDKVAVRILCSAGVVLDYGSGPDLAALRAALQPVYDAIARDPQSKTWLGQIEALKVETAAATDVLACPGKAAPAATAHDGIPAATYERTVTLAELKTHPLYQDWWPAGRSTLTFKDGVMTQVNPVGNLQTHTYTLYRGRIKAETSGPVDFVASYRIDGEKLYLTDFSWPDCTDCGTDEAAYGTTDTKPWIRVR
ncbi:hypothetical protein [Kribbella sp. NPDC006257]|uniref:hypothetical protein n=1 Tax=Kribbella sp. NPDC006257 TaxID=3156738 RepID=UPI0033B1A2E5